MSSIVTGILSSTVGLLWNKARDTIAAKLKDGDVTDARIREIVVRELNDIKIKLDGLSRKDLLTSYSFLQEGVDLLNVSLDKSKCEQKALWNEIQYDNDETSSGVEFAVLNEALELSHDMGKLKINSDKEFESAKKRFEDARKKATEAFCNEALSINDRIFAAKLRVVSEILENLESPETAVTGCLSFLKKLHDLPAIQEIFSVYLNGGVKSILNKAERMENVKSVMLINNVLFQFVSKFSSKSYFVLAWPTIELADRRFSPILNWLEVSTMKSMGEQLTQHANGLTLDEEIYPYLSAVNGHGDVLVGGYYDNIKIFSRTGDRKVVKLPIPQEGEILQRRIAGIAVDNNNNVYVARWFKTRTENGDVNSYVLYVLDEKHNVKRDCILDFFGETDFDLVRIARNKKNIIMIKVNDRHVYVCANTGQLQHKFEADSHVQPSLSISGSNEIMIPSHDEKVVHIYTEEGILKSKIKVPASHVVWSVAFHYAMCKVIVLTYNKKKDSYFLLCYSETGKLEISMFFCKKIRHEYPDITSHPSGHVAVVEWRSIAFI